MSLVTLVLLLIPVFAGGVAAQTAGTITGTVEDASGGVLPGVSVTARNSATGLTRVVVTRPDGRFVLAALIPGTYELRAELAGFKPHVRRDLAVPIASTINLNITLVLGDLAIEDVVVGVTPLVNTSTSELSYLVGSEAIERLPLNGRNYTDLALLQPGVNAFPHRDGGSAVAHGLGMSSGRRAPAISGSCRTCSAFRTTWCTRPGARR